VRKPKLRELKEAIRAAFGPRFTTRYPFGPLIPFEGFRGQPRFQEDSCIGCKACAEVCPALAITVVDNTDADPPVRRLVQHGDKCIFCGQCELNCTTKEGIKLTPEYDLATLDMSTLVEPIEHELVICEACDVVVGTKKHLRWVAEKLGAKAYANPTLIVAADGAMSLAAKDAGRSDEPSLARNDMMRVLCPACRRTTVVRELWGE